MQEKANREQATTLAVKVNQLFASFNQKFEATKREGAIAKQAEGEKRLLEEENAGLRRKMLAMETAR